MRRIVFWQNMLAFHQVAHIRQLSRLGYEIIWVAEENISAERKLHGWKAFHSSSIDTVVNPNDSDIEHLIAHNPQTTIHVFSGARGFPLIKKVFQQCVRKKRHIAILIENRDDRGVKGFLRWLTYLSDAIRYRSRIKFMLIMGYSGQHGGHRWYRRCGFLEQQLFPYGYFVDGPECTPEISRERNAEVEILYIGQLIPRKGVDILLRALAQLSSLSWRFKIIGDGVSHQELKELTETLGIAARIELFPFMKNEEAMQQFATADLFVLPSRFDGWGVVGNEALLHGVPLICSDRCGVQDLIQEAWRGEIFPSESVEGLAKVLEKWIAKGKRTQETSNRIYAWTKCISGTSAAHYFDKVLNFVENGGERPVPEWMSVNEGESASHSKDSTALS